MWEISYIIIEKTFFVVDAKFVQWNYTNLTIWYNYGHKRNKDNLLQLQLLWPLHARKA